MIDFYQSFPIFQSNNKKSLSKAETFCLLKKKYNETILYGKIKAAYEISDLYE